MRTLLLVSLLAATAVAGCAKPADHAAAEQPPKISAISVDELDQMLARQECKPVDANGDSTRRQMGVIPGAVLLTDMDSLDKLPADKVVMLKLTLPEQDDFYADFVRHPRVLKVVALSGGYSLAESNARLARNHGVVASFSRALAEGLFAQQSDAEFNAKLDATIEGIYQASKT